MASQAALGVSISLMALGVLLWLDRERRRGYQRPKHRVPTVVYRLMERARERLFKGSDQVRLTVFMPHPARPVLIPYARIGWGQPSAESDAEFAAGQGLAGMAVEFRGMLIARMGPFEDLERARRAHASAFRLTDKQVAALSKSQLKVTVMIAIPLWQGELLKGVLSIDSLDPAVIPMDADTSFWNSLNQLAADLAESLPDSKAVVEQGRFPEVQGASVSHIRLYGPVRPTQESIPLPTLGASLERERVAV